MGDVDANDDRITLGPCCACGGREHVRNVMMLPFKAPIPGRGWGCLQCGLSMDGAMAVVCDACAETDQEVLYACDGSVKDAGRILISDLHEPHRHDESKHPELTDTSDTDDTSLGAVVDEIDQFIDTANPPPVIFDGFLSWYTEWFDPSDDRCSLCSGLIPEESVPLILFKDVPSSGQTWQARICEPCVPVAMGRLRASRTPPQPGGPQVGSIAIATRTTGVCDIGERGVCYEVYVLGGRPGYSFIFESGRYDGFSPDEIGLMLTITSDVCASVRDYQFTNVTVLERDFRRGVFAEAFR